MNKLNAISAATKAATFALAFVLFAPIAAAVLIQAAQIVA